MTLRADFPLLAAMKLVIGIFFNEFKLRLNLKGRKLTAGYCD